MEIIRNKAFFQHLRQMVPGLPRDCIEVTIELKSEHIAMVTVVLPVKNTPDVQRKTYLVTAA